MSTATVGDAQPNERDAALARDALARVKDYLARHRGEAHEPVRVRVDEAEEQPLTLPRVSVELMARVLAHIAAGQTVAIVPNHAELTTPQAADILNVSRPYLINLLDEGKIGYRRVGTHRRIVASSLLEYKRADDVARRSAADELAANDSGARRRLMAFVVVYDACVLHPSTLRDLLIRIAQSDNLRDFPAKTLDQWGIEAKSADDFVLGQLHLDAPSIYVAVQQIADAWRNPPGTSADVLDRLERNGLVASVAFLRS